MPALSASEISQNLRNRTLEIPRLEASIIFRESIDLARSKSSAAINNLSNFTRRSSQTSWENTLCSRNNSKNLNARSRLRILPRATNQLQPLLDQSKSIETYHKSSVLLMIHELWRASSYFLDELNWLEVLEIIPREICQSSETFFENEPTRQFLSNQVKINWNLSKIIRRNFAFLKNLSDNNVKIYQRLKLTSISLGSQTFIQIRIFEMKK